MPWADLLFAMDRKWWERYLGQVEREFAGERVSGLSIRGVQRIHRRFQTFGNSGAAVIALAIDRGAERVILLGYDCQHTDGKRHHHGDHPKGLGNAGSVHKWPQQFADVATKYRDARIINCSRETALKCFPRAALEDVIG